MAQFIPPTSSSGMLHLRESGWAWVSAVPPRSQNAARENQTVLCCVQHTGKPHRPIHESDILQSKRAKLSTFLLFKVHSHPSRRGHCPRPLRVAEDVARDYPLPRHKMQLFAVLCIQTSHYVSFVKYGPNPHSWLFFDCMADRCGKIPAAFARFEFTAFFLYVFMLLLNTFLMFVQAPAVPVKWLRMTSSFSDNAAVTVYDKAALTSVAGLYLATSWSLFLRLLFVNR